MKKLLLALLLATAGVSFTATADAKKEDAKTAKARKECLKTDKTLTGEKLEACIRSHNM